MIICTKKMDFPLGAQCQRVQKQVMKGSHEKERASLLYMKALASRGSVDAVWQQMTSHPRYMESFLRTQHYILTMDGPLPLPYRHYITIMAAARHQCSYLVSLHSAQFLRVGGDPLWLQGLQAAPPRLRHLDHINKVLAHQPWLTACSHIQALLKTGEQCWSLAELVQGVVLLAHCHALCSFVFGSGVDADPAPIPRTPRGTPPPGYRLTSDAANGNVNGSPTSPTPASEHAARRWSLDSAGETVCLKDRIHKTKEEERRAERLLQSHTLQQTDTEEDEALVLCAADPAHFITDPDFGYQEFARRDDDHFQVFRVQDYSWEDHGFSLVNRLYSDIGHLLDERFRSVMALRSSHAPDRTRAVWNYIHCMLGIRYDDYDYGEVSQLLGRELKLFIKTVACFPNASKTPPPLPWGALTPAERVHVNLLVMEARLQAELLYALRAITQYMIA